jgi:glycosyltransferase involved in cell wall biosynthesis
MIREPVHLSIITAATRPAGLAQVVNDFKSQRIQGVSFEHIIVLEGGGFDNVSMGQARVIRQERHDDFGATAKDVGIAAAIGEYVAFWDDDNVYYDHAVATIVAATWGHDVGLYRCRYLNRMIPNSDKLEAGDVDTMCFCVRRELAKQVTWADGLGRYSDWRWINKIGKKPNYVPVVIGEKI